MLTEVTHVDYEKARKMFRSCYWLLCNDYQIINIIVIGLAVEESMSHEQTDIRFYIIKKCILTNDSSTVPSQLLLPYRPVTLNFWFPINEKLPYCNGEISGSAFTGVHIIWYEY